MALPGASPAPLANPQVIGNAFVLQYYQILHQYPEQVHKFYQDSSILSRPDVDGVTTSVTTIQAINDKILSWDFRNCFTEIETVDSQSSYKEGVLIVVTGSFTASDVKQKFAQSFYLAPQDNGGYFVLNDVFRLFKETVPLELSPHLGKGTHHETPNTRLTPKRVVPTSQGNHVEESPLPEVGVDNNEVIDTTGMVSSAVEDKAILAVPENENRNHRQPVHKTVDSAAQDDMSKKSYASILKFVDGGTTPKMLVYVPTDKANVTPPTDKSVTKASAPDAEIVVNKNAIPEKSNSLEEEGFSVYIRNLPVDATPGEVEQEFKKFGTIKPGGVQVRNQKVDNFCFGFVEFDSAESMQAAIKASPLELRGYISHVEQKRTTTRVVNGVVTYSMNGSGGRGSYYQQGGRNGFRNDNFRARGNFGPNFGQRRNDFRSHADYNGRGRGFQQRVYHNSNGYGNGRVGQRLNGGSKEIPVA